MKQNQEAEARVAAALSSCALFSAAEVWDVLDSTNNRVRDLACQNAPEGTLVLAEGQTNGRGRMGRRFVSPQSTGLYMSLLLRPRSAAVTPGLITACAAVAVWQAVKNLTGVATEIKWVNDIYKNGKKLCGILAEGQLRATGRLAYAVLGIGVNLQKPRTGYDGEIADIVTSVAEIAPQAAVSSLDLCQEIFKCFAALYAELPRTDFLSVYRAASCVLGKRITYMQNGIKQQGVAVSVDEAARLVVRQEDGSLSTLETGEISLLRPLE